MFLTTSEHKKIDDLVETVLTCLSFLSEQCEFSDQYKIGIKHTIQQIIAIKVSEIVLADSADVDSVADYLLIDNHVKSFSTRHTIERNEKIRQQVKTEILQFLDFIDENL